MSKIARIMQQATAGAGGAGLDVDEVFSTYLYDGTGSTQTITNGIDLSGEGGLVWTKVRDATYDHWLFDTARGAEKKLSTNNTGAQGTTLGALQQFNSNGYQLGYSGGAYAELNQSGKDYVSWTFRKAPKFFDVVTYTGAAYVDQTVSHNLGSVPGMIIIKCTSSARRWVVYHRSLGNTKHLHLNTTDAESTENYFNNTDPTDTTFTVEGGDSDVNGYNETYVAYLFAHNDGDGDFGPDGDADIIKCGSYTGNGSTDGPEIDLGFEPQWVLIKNATNGTSSDSWRIVDSMRGLTAGSGDDWLLSANESSAETDYQVVGPTATGFKVNTTSVSSNTSGSTYIYIAIRRGPMAVPTDATDVFAIDGENTSEPYHTSGFPVDMGLKKRQGSTGSWFVMDRLRQGKKLASDSTGAEVAETDAMFDDMNGMYAAAAYGQDASYGWMWKRAPNYFDVVAYTGNGTAGRTVSHNLGVVPEMIWFKSRSNAQNWYVYHKDNTYISGALSTYLRLNTTDARINSSYFMSSISSSDFGLTIGTPNDSGKTYIAYLFASLDGVSKVGSYTGSSSAQTIDCGFSSGARFVMIKNVTDSGTNWIIFDATRGIVSGNDPYLFLNANSAEDVNGSYDYLDPHSSGFTLEATNFFDTNDDGKTYIFYAVA